MIVGFAMATLACNDTTGRDAMPKAESSVGVLALHEQPPVALERAAEPDSSASEGLHNVWAAATATDGTFYIGNSGNQAVLSFAPNGTLRQRVGRRGDGPGEYRDINGLFIDRQDTIRVYDGVTQRLTVYHPITELIRTEDLRQYPMYKPKGLLKDGRVVLFRAFARPPRQLPGWDSSAIILADVSKRSADTIAWVRHAYFDSPVPSVLPIGAYLGVAGGNIIYAENSDSILVVMSPDGGTRRLAMPLPAPSMTDLDWQQVQNANIDLLQSGEAGHSSGPASPQMQRAAEIRAMPKPQNVPRFYAMVTASEGLVWLRLGPPLRVGGHQRWLIVDLDAMTYRHAELPENVRVLEVTRDFVTYLQMTESGERVRRKMVRQ